jgi:hypothetical protein
MGLPFGWCRHPAKVGSADTQLRPDEAGPKMGHADLCWDWACAREIYPTFVAGGRPNA